MYIMKKSMCLIFFILFFLHILPTKACEVNLLPYPQQTNFGNECFIIDKVNLKTPILKNKLEIFIRESGGSLCDKTDKTIEVRLINSIGELKTNLEEAYRLKVYKNNIIIEAITERGVYMALQTLYQLQVNKDDYIYIRECEITDWPAFRVRGFMHDVGRTYISMDELKKEIDLLSKFKINVFHWHLTENQAWRLESKLYPELNSPENMTRMPGKFYTLDEAKELVEFCKERYVTLIPEIDMPGHSEAFVRAFKTDMQSEKGIKILKNLMDEVCETFDVPYIHIGTDEVEFTNHDFVPEMVSYIRNKGKKVLSWNPGWNYRPGEIDMTQLWSYRGKAQKGIPAIDCKFHYINHFDIYADLVALYNSRICNVDKGDGDIAGSIIAIWNDRYIDNEKQILADNNFYANMLAFAERSWRGGGNCYFDGKGTLLWPENTAINKEFEDFENRMLWHKYNTLKGEPFPYVKQSNVKWKITEAFPNDGNLDMSFPPEHEESDFYKYKGKEYKTSCIYGAGVYLRHVWGNLVPGFYDKPKENHTAYAYTWVHSPIEQKVGLNIDFQNYSRSESDLPPLPGTWDYKGSRIWLNKEEILPPHWINNHKERSNEIALANENSASRPPIKVTLNKGWNKIFIKLPVGRFQSKETRLVKWMFNVVFVSIDGKAELKNIVYSTDNPYKN